MSIVEFYPLISVTGISLLLLSILEWTFRRKIAKDPSNKYYRQLTINLFIVLVVIALIAASPISGELKGQILGLIGIVISGAIALSSTSLLGNTLAGIMLKITRNFKSGDFISVNDITGKVASRTLLNIEVQTFDRGLIFLPNIYLVTHPVKVFPKSGVFVSVEVSLGYDVPRHLVEQATLAAAKLNDIDSAYLEVKKLLDFSVLYSLNALVTNLDSYVTVKSKLHADVIDQLHLQKIEIVSPNFMNTRAMSDAAVIPQAKRENQDIEEAIADNIDDLLFDKANYSDTLEVLQQKRQRIESLLAKEGGESSRGQRLNNKLETIENAIIKVKRELERL